MSKKTKEEIIDFIVMNYGMNKCLIDNYEPGHPVDINRLKTLSEAFTMLLKWMGVEYAYGDKI